jgi:acetyl esterase
MSLDPEMAAVLEAIKGMKPMEEMSVDELRASMVPLPLEKRTVVASVDDRKIAGDLAIRVYQTFEPSGRSVILYFHGGGYVLGDLETHDHVCRDLCEAAGAAVVALDYRRAPEHKFPAALDDCLTAARCVSENASRLGLPDDRVILAGDSAGATLAAVTAIRLRDEGGPKPRGQIMAYPVTDYHSPGTRSYFDNGSGFSLTRNAMIRFWSDYLASETDASNPHASPLRATNLSGLPPALVMTAEFDPLRDEGDAYAEKLARHGVPVTHLRYDGMIHGFLRMSHVSERARSAFVEIGRWVRALP